MELIFFLVILGIQFVYQIYLAINKKKRRIQKESEQSAESTDPYSFSEEPSENLESQSHSFSELSEPEPEYDNRVSDTVSEPVDSNEKQVKNLYNQFFGFINQSEGDFNRSQEEEVFSYDDEVEREEEFSPAFSSSPSTADRAVDDDVSKDYSNLVKKDILSSQSRIKKQLRNPQTLKDSWRIKFVLDRPGGLLGERNLF